MIAFLKFTKVQINKFLALMEMEIPRHCEARSNLVDCNGQQELQLLKMREQFAPKEK